MAWPATSRASRRRQPQPSIRRWTRTCAPVARCDRTCARSRWRNACVASPADSAAAACRSSASRASRRVGPIDLASSSREGGTAIIRHTANRSDPLPGKAPAPPQFARRCNSLRSLHPTQARACLRTLRAGARAVRRSRRRACRRGMVVRASRPAPRAARPGGPTSGSTTVSNFAGCAVAATSQSRVSPAAAQALEHLDPAGRVRAPDLARARHGRGDARADRLVVDPIRADTRRPARLSPEQPAQALEVAGRAHVHRVGQRREAARGVVAAAREEIGEHAVRVGRQHHPADRQAHRARHEARRTRCRGCPWARRS